MCVNDVCVCVIKLIGWKMDGWIGLSGCGKWMESGCGCGKWKVESGTWRGSGSHTCSSASSMYGTRSLNWVLAACCWHWLIENRLRTSMTQERLVNLAIMSIESEIHHALRD